MINYPRKWGFLDSPEKCVGKAIERADLVKMEFGCTWKTAWALRFTDGTRAFFVGGRGSGVMNPSTESVRDSPVFEPSELGEMIAEEKRRVNTRAALRTQRKREQLAKLKKELGEE